MNLMQMREKRNEIATQARALLDEADADGVTEERSRDLNAQFDAAMAEHDELDKKIARREKLEAIEARQDVEPSNPKKRPLHADIDTRDDDDDDDEDGGPTTDYREVFMLQLKYGAASLTAEQRNVMLEHRTADVKQMLAGLSQENRALAAGTDGAGGHTVPEGFVASINERMAIWGPMWDQDIVTSLDTATGAPLPWPGTDDTANEGREKAENAAVDDDGTDDPTFTEIVFNAYFVDTGMVRIPWELLQDSAFDMEALVGMLFGKRIGRIANRRLTTGTGSSQAHGIVTASAVGETAAATAAIASDELINLQHSVDPAYRASPMCRWQFHDDTLAHIRKLKDGDGNYLWQMGDVRTGAPALLLDKPWTVNQAMATLATGNRTVIFGDHSEYVRRRVLGFQTMTLRERYAENFQVGMVGFARFDGKLLQSTAVKHLVQA